MAEVKKIEQPERYWDRLFANVGQLAMITTSDVDGRVNAATFATCVRVVHNPVHIAFTTSTHKHTYKNVLATKEFTVNLPSFERELLEKACTIGLPFDAGVNELEKAGLTSLPSIKVKPPRIQECRRHFECELVWFKEWVDRVMIVGNVISASVDSDCVDDRGFIVWDRCKPVQYCGAPYQKYVDQPPYPHMFVAAYETMSVHTPYDGPEMDRHDDMVAQEIHFR
jgi:flavin reductase (DIM6/NTAB) family NADH-FMN oxidoreductase RutF